MATGDDGIFPTETQDSSSSFGHGNRHVCETWGYDVETEEGTTRLWGRTCTTDDDRTE